MNVKSIIKKVSLVLAGITAITATFFGVKAIVDYTKNDLKTITPTFEVGNLGTDGKYVNDESTLYTKSAFEAEGLQVKLDFDAQIDYQIFYYDDLDNFVESTAVLSAAYSETVHDGYARIVIIPTDDEDDKISLTERLTYPAQMTIKVNKEQDIQYHNVFNKRLMIVDSVSQLRFKHYYVTSSSGENRFVESQNHGCTSMDLLNICNNKSISFTSPGEFTGSSCHFNLFIFNKNYEFIKSESIECGSTYIFADTASYVVIQFSTYDVSTDSYGDVSSLLLSRLNNYINLSK